MADTVALEYVGGCVEYLEYKDGKIYFRDVFLTEATAEPLEKKMKVEVGDIRYGCCGDCIIRGNEIYTVMEPRWFYARLGDVFTTYAKYVVKDLPLDKIYSLLKKTDAEFVMSTVEKGD